MGGGQYCVGGDGFCVDGGFSMVVVAMDQWWQFFPSFRSGYCVGGDGCACPWWWRRVAGLGLNFLKIDFLHARPNTRNNFLV